jgi:hypothetical protein
MFYKDRAIINELTWLKERRNGWEVNESEVITKKGRVKVRVQRTKVGGGDKDIGDGWW